MKENLSKLEAWREGYEAWLAGKSVSDHPYPASSIEARAFRGGYEAAMLDGKSCY